MTTYLKNFFRPLFYEPRSIQEVFDIVIANNFYRHKRMKNVNNENVSEPFMCFALELAHYYGYITSEELVRNQNAIDRYLGNPSMPLTAMLQHNGFPHKPVDTLAVYLDWANKPRLLKGK